MRRLFAFNIFFNVKYNDNVVDTINININGATQLVTF